MAEQHIVHRKKKLRPSTVSNCLLLVSRNIYIYIVSRKLCSVFPRAFVLSFLVALSLLKLPNVYTKDIRDIEKVLLLLIIITITKLSNLIGYKLP